jgi:hypothetical protein
MATTPSAEQVIEIASLSQMLAANEFEKLGLLGGGLDKRHARMLYVERKSLEWMYGLSSSEETLIKVSNYVYALCGMFGLKAQYLINTGTAGVITPVIAAAGFSFDYLIPVGAADFDSATTYDDPRIVGKSIVVFWNNIPRYLVAGEWDYTATGIEILIDGFDATAPEYADAQFYIYIVNPVATAANSQSETFSLQYYGVGTETFFTSPDLVNREVLEVIRTTGYGVITSGAPAALQALFTAPSGRIDFAASNPLETNELVIVLYK